MRAYSMDLRVRVLKDCDGGMTTAAAAAKYSVSPAWVRRLKQRRAATGEVAPRVARPRPPARAAHAEQLRAAIRDTPDATLAELKARLALSVSLATLWRAVRDLGLTVKKKSSGRPSKTGRTSRRSGRPSGPASRTSTRGG
jgi:transposase